MNHHDRNNVDPRLLDAIRRVLNSNLQMPLYVLRELQAILKENENKPWQRQSETKPAPRW